MSLFGTLKRAFKNPGKIPMNILYRMPYISHSMSDEKYLKIIYRFAIGRKLNLDNPKTFNEKLQWLKIHDHNPQYSIMVDKYAAKKYVADKIGTEYIIPTIGVWDKFEDIDFDLLPNKFVLKCTHDSGGLVICRNKSTLDLKLAQKKINKSLKRNFYWVGREWAYKDVPPRIIAEEFMEDKSNKSMIDYKFYCFNGKPEFLYISQGLENHETARISYVTLDWKIAPYKRTDYSNFDVLPPKPANFPGSGLSAFEPEEWDKKLGERMVLPIKNILERNCNEKSIIFICIGFKRNYLFCK